ncbi:hypothetical protein [Epilithonimonas zeae]|uniref:hypothetical protein n=1 Tax=Epilithonimonas zeae TaxID=1416779 RepID=UPI00200EAD43|nr:hypothetical protein [Epilithonimonas zeae]UQB68883.1 hypothetical protein KI430_00090 [Epilithonimonas zeae]
MIKKTLRKNKILFFTSLFFLLFFSCENKEKHSEILYKNHMLKQNVLLKGDIKSYNKLYNYYEYENNLDELLTSSIIMANKYNDSNAQFQVFTIMMNAFYDSENDRYIWDKESLDIVFSYLKKAVLAGNANAVTNLKFHTSNYNDELTVTIKKDAKLSKYVE